MHTEGDEEGSSQQDEGEVAIPAEIAADFILIESQVFGDFQILFDMPASADGLHDEGERRVRGRPDQVIGHLSRIIQAAPKDEEVASIDGALVQEGQDGPIKEALALGALALREALPVGRAQGTRREAAHISQQGTGWGLDTHDFGGRHRQRVGVALLLQEGAQLGAVTIDGIGHDPVDGEVSLVSALHHTLGQFGFGGKADGVGDMGSLPAWQIAAPLLGQVQFAVDQGMAASGDVGEEDADLAIFHASAHATILRCDASGVATAFGNYVSSKITTLDQQEELVATSPLADSLPRFSVTNLHTLREQKFAAGLHKEPVVLPISFNASTHPFTVEPDLHSAP